MARFERKQYVFREGDTVDCIYIVFKGNFEMERRLPHPDMRKPA